MLSVQQAFETIVTHLRKQNAKSMVNGQCAYRSDNGLKCAIGCLIPDELYTSEIEGKNVTHDHVKKIIDKIVEADSRIGYEALGWHVLYRLQRIHDTCNIENWEEEFKLVAERYHLKEV